MKHESISMDLPIELIEITPINPNISKCQIKVCYVGDKPNRNKSIITKETAKQLANSIPGSPIVGYYNEETGDFEEHNKRLGFKNGQMIITENTRPYGFVDLGAKVWFEKFKDDGVEHEYLVTEGYLWTGQYPECERVISHGSNQSMDLDRKNLNAFWTKDNNGKPQFFIINEAIMSKLCILGDDYEPCFEGSQITSTQFSLNDFKEQLFSLVDQMKKILKEEEGGASMFSKIDIEIGGSLWNAVYAYANADIKYSIYGMFEEEGQIFAVLQNEDKSYRVDFSFDENEYKAGEITDFELTEDMGEAQFSAEAIIEYEKTLEPAGNLAPATEPVPVEEPAVEPEKNKVVEEPKNVEFKIEECEEYKSLATDYANLLKEKQTLEATIASLNETINSLSEFKKTVERQDKQKMIDSFYMLSDGDKTDVIQNIDKYSIDDIEAKLSIICVRNRVSFAQEPTTPVQEPIVYNVNNIVTEDEDMSIPAWVREVRKIAKTLD